jgi:hypothetical protein
MGRVLVRELETLAGALQVLDVDAQEHDLAGVRVRGGGERRRLALAGTHQEAQKLTTTG